METGQGQKEIELLVADYGVALVAQSPPTQGSHSGTGVAQSLSTQGSHGGTGVALQDFFSGVS